MKNEKIIKAWNMLDPSDTTKNRIFDRIEEKRKVKHQIKRPVFRTAALLTATAAVICVAVLGVRFLTRQGQGDPDATVAQSQQPQPQQQPQQQQQPPQSQLPPQQQQPSVSSTLQTPGSAYTFSLVAYTVHALPDGSFGLREVDLLDQPDVWGSYFDGENGLYYVSVGLRAEGENIRSVEFSVAEGFFAKQYIGDLKNKEGVMRSYVGSDSRLVMVGDEFDIVGNVLVLENNEMVDDLLLFWGMEIDESDFYNSGVPHPDKIDVNAIATFNNGATAERTVTIDLSGPGVGGVRPSDAEIERMYQEHLARYEYFMNIPLEEMELIPESVSRLTLNPVYDAYYFVYDAGYGEQAILVQEEHTEFDEHGMCRKSFGGGPIGDHMVVLMRDAEGEIIGMLYKVAPFTP